MVIGVLQVELTIPGSLSLKDKRRVVQSLKTKLHQEHMVSVAETGTLDSVQTATLGIVLAATDVSYAQSVLSTIERKIQHHRDCVLADSSVQFLTGIEPGQEPQPDDEVQRGDDQPWDDSAETPHQ
jgi:uncharacterized protein